MAKISDYHKRILLKDEMYPRFQFLKQRLLSIYTRFNAVIEKKGLAELLQDGERLLRELEKRLVPFKDAVGLILVEGNTFISQTDFNSKYIASSKYCLKEEDKKKRQPIKQEDIDDIMKNIHARPEVIVCVVKKEWMDKKVFEDYLLLTLPESALESCIFCSESYDELIILQRCKFENYEIVKKDVLLGMMIQTVLEDKVVSALQSVEHFIESNIHSSRLVPSSEGREELIKAFSETLITAGCAKRGRGNVIHQICGEVGNKICMNLTYKCEANQHIIDQAYKKTAIFQSMVAFLHSVPNFVTQPVMEKERLCEECVKQLAPRLKDFENNLLETFELISKIGFEINGVFRQAGITKRAFQEISSELREKILSLSGVCGAGTMCGRLVVHIDENSKDTIEEITEKVCTMVMELKTEEWVISGLKVKRVRVSSNAGNTHESGKCIRVKTNASYYAYGTLGCFVKGHVDGANEEMYALSSAHIFSSSNLTVVEIANDYQTDNYCILGNLLPGFKMREGQKIDIAAIAVSSPEKRNCHVHLKNSKGLDSWGNMMYEGDLKKLLGFHVYKRGSKSNVTEGLVTSNDYKSRGLGGFDDHYNLFIESLPSSEESETFSSAGDSGSVVCKDDTHNETVQVLSILSGAMYDALTGNYICSYSCHLKKNLLALSGETGKTFELYV